MYLFGLRNMKSARQLDRSVRLDMIGSQVLLLKQVLQNIIRLCICLVEHHELLIVDKHRNECMTCISLWIQQHRNSIDDVVAVRFKS